MALLGTGPGTAGYGPGTAGYGPLTAGYGSCIGINILSSSKFRGTEISFLW